MKLINKVAKYLKSKVRLEGIEPPQANAHWNLNPVDSVAKSRNSRVYAIQADAGGVNSCQELGENRGRPICIWEGLPEVTVDGQD